MYILKRGEISYRYRLSGSRARSSVVKEDIAASNGVIHVVQKLLTNSADVKGDNSVRRTVYIFCLHVAVLNHLLFSLLFQILCMLSLTNR